jgi:NADPH:quinone reductase-like Zn-dependent oxidoreductase
MARAVRFSRYGDVDVLAVEDVPRPATPPGHVLVEVVSSSINPGEIMIREGAFHEVWPSTFPSGQGSDLAGRIVETGDGVTDLDLGTEVIGFTNDRAAQADYVVVPAEQVTAKPQELDFDVAGSLFVAGTTAWASLNAVDVKAGETVVVTAAAGGVGSLVVQLARRAGANVIGIAGPANEKWLTAQGVTVVTHGPGVPERLRAAAPQGIDAFLDNFGAGYVEIALELGVPADRINTIIDFEAVKRLGVKSEGNAEGASATVLAELAQLAVKGELEVPIAATYPLEQVREAYTRLAERHTHGKIVLRLR